MDIKKASVNYLGQGNNNLSKKRRARLLEVTEKQEVKQKSLN